APHRRARGTPGSSSPADRAELASHAGVRAVHWAQTRLGPPVRGCSSTVQMRRTAAPPSLIGRLPSCLHVP
ncbi:hypothetical protein AB0D38_16570, partial [Streptomyces sp. NPDC048279]|uniref:hypothetical protein n=1 Tax=Streptomyces sp. NPDC048279 TaxID=3154714 RepID=UPI00341E69FA